MSSTLKTTKHYSKSRQKWLKGNAEKLRVYYKDYYANNKEQIVAKRQLWRESNVEKLKAKKKEYYATNKHLILASHKTPGGKIHMYRTHAKKRGLDFVLTTDDFNALLFSECHYCGKQEAYGVDRKDNKIGYFSYNVVACCWDCNSMKGARDYQQFINHIQKMHKQLF